jgi:hypothetical protein
MSYLLEGAIFTCVTSHIYSGLLKPFVLIWLKIDCTFCHVLLFVFCFFKTGSHCVAQAVLQLVIFLPLHFKCWDYRCVPPCLTKAVFSPRALCMLGNALPQSYIPSHMCFFLFFCKFFTSEV